MGNRSKNQHLLWRAGFGPDYKLSSSLNTSNSRDIWKNIIEGSREKPKKFIVAQNLMLDYFKGEKDLDVINKIAKENKEEINAIKLKMRQSSLQDLKTLNNTWVDEMINSKAQLREKMSLFWHGHFACRITFGYYQQELLHIIRENSLGNFGDLLKAVSKSPAMLVFLNNNNNRKRSPNENFAREVMELFTLGRGNYTEMDVKEAARAFTGWNFNPLIEFEVRDDLHDEGVKTFLGQTGNFNGDDVLNILLKNKQTALFITTKIYKYFVNDKIDEKKIQWLADRFYAGNYNILNLMEDIFTSEWFFEEKNIGAKIKSPIELIAGIRRMMPLTPKGDGGQILFQKILGQVLFFPPNVAGWPGGSSWIDSSTLMARLQIPRVWANKEVMRLIPKDDDDVQMGKKDMDVKEKRNKGDVNRAGGSLISWELVMEIYKNVQRENLYNEIVSSLVQIPVSFPEELMKKHTDNESRENFITSNFIQIMSTPEYQVC
ncbi:MAG: DUF1800 domain-containing protein [Ferruginibacter sp.]